MVVGFKDKLKNHIKDVSSAMELVEKEERKREEERRIEAERQREIAEASQNEIGLDLDEVMEKRRLERIKERAAEKLEEEKISDEKKEANIEKEMERIKERELRIREAELAERERERKAIAEEARIKKEEEEDEARKAKRAKAWNTTKKVGRGAVAVGAGLMTNLAVNPAKKTVAAMHGETPKSIVSLFWFAVFVHGIIVALLLFGMDSGTLILISMLLYTLLTLLAIFSFRKAGAFDSSSIGWLIGISAFCIILPLILSYVPNIPLLGTTTLYDWVLWFRLIIPVWAIYLGMKFDIPVAKGYVILILGILLFFFVLNYGLNINTSQLMAMGFRPTDISRSTAVFSYIAQEGKSMISNFAKRIGDPNTWLNKTESYLGLNYYTSTIDDTEQEPVGFYITNVRSEDRYFYEGQPATVVADVRGKSFVDELFVVPSCYIDKRGDGTATPSSFRILGEEQGAFYCRFTDLPKGSYTSKVSATFDFETWAYLEYNFVDVEIKRAYDAKGESINSALKISTATKSVSTPGPIRLGMASSDLTQPILIDKTYNTRRPVIGASLINAWTDGKIGEVYQFVLSIPNDFELQDCSRGAPASQANENITGYTDYIFTRDLLGDPRSSFEQFRCFLYLREPGTFFASGVESAKRTFIGRVKYRYQLEKSVSLIVKP